MNVVATYYHLLISLFLISLVFLFQFQYKTMHLNAIGNRNVSYNQESFVTAYYDVLIHGLTITKAGFYQHLDIFFSLKFQIFKNPQIILFLLKTLAQAAMKHQIPRKTLEYYVKGKATHDSYQKMGLPLPTELAQYTQEEKNLVETVQRGLMYVCFIYDFKYNYFHLIIIIISNNFIIIFNSV